MQSNFFSAEYVYIPTGGRINFISDLPVHSKKQEVITTVVAKRRIEPSEIYSFLSFFFLFKAMKYFLIATISHFREISIGNKVSFVLARDIFDP